MTVYNRARRVEQRRTLERGTWAGTDLLVIAYDTTGTGTIETDLIDFGTAFAEPPFFSYGVELIPGKALIAGDFPIVNCGVKEWETTEVDETSQAEPVYLGAYAWIHVRSNSAYNLRFRFGFEGTALRNVEYFRGTQ